MTSSKNYVSLHVHSQFSLLDGLGRVDDYMQRASELGMPALALTDHGHLYGWPDFYDSAVAHGVKPILGIEAYQARIDRFNTDPIELSGKATDEIDDRGPYHLTVLARNKTGYHNLIKLSSRSFIEGFLGGKARVDHELINDHADGLIIGSGCLNGEVSKTITNEGIDAAVAVAAKMQDIVGKDNYFIEVMDHGIEEERAVLPKLVEVAERIKAPVIPTQDSHYVRLPDSSLHDTLLCISTKSTIDQEKRFRFVPDEFYLKSYEEMAKRFNPIWLKNSLRVAESVEDLNLTFGENHFPEFPVPEEHTLDTFFVERVWEGVRKRYGSDFSDTVRDRAEYELRVIREMGFQSYFLVVADLVNWARDNGIRIGEGRGSAAGSLVSYCLWITNLDPLRYNLSFERFLVEGRKTPPDIDLDIDDRYRDRVVAYAQRKYGAANVSHIATFSTLKARSALRDTARVLGYQATVGAKAANLIPPPVMGFSKTITEAKNTKDFLEVYTADEDVKKIVDIAERLEGLTRQSGIHAAGVIITPRPVTDYIPVMQRTNPKGERTPVTSQWPMGVVERNGLLKIDFLGLRTLSIIDLTVENIKKTKGIELDIDNVPLDDSATYEMLCQGHGEAVFQLSSSGMKRLTIAMQPDRIEDIMALVALFRPGPLGAGMDKLYTDRKHGRDTSEAIHPVLEDLLADTYGVMLYQDDVLRVAREVAGFSPLEADDLRKVLGKKILEKMPLFRQRFVEGSVSTAGVPGHIAERIFSHIAYFAGYGFNMAHSLSYGVLSYRTAYLKRHFPTEYMAALLTSTKKEKAAPYLHECRRLGLIVLPPSINTSESEFTIEDDTTILFGLASIDGIGDALLEHIMKRRKKDDPYRNLLDFMRRNHHDAIGKKALEHLAGSGALDELIPEQPPLILQREDKSVLLKREMKELGLFVSEHPLTGIWHLLEPSLDRTIEALPEVTEGTILTVGGILVGVTRKVTKRGDTMYILVLEDLTGRVEVLVFPGNVKSLGEIPEVGDIVLIKGRLGIQGDDENVEYNIRFLELTHPELPSTSTDAPIFLSYRTQPTYDHLLQLNKVLNRERGNTPVQISFPEDGMIVSMEFKTLTVPKARQELEELWRSFSVV